MINISSYQPGIDSINASIQKIRKLHIAASGYHNAGLFMIVFVCMFLGPALSIGLSDGRGDTYILSMVAFFIVVFPLGSYLSAWFIRHILEKRFESMLGSHERMLEKFINISSLEESLSFLEDTRKLLIKTISFSKRNGEYGKNLLINEIAFCKELMNDIRNLLLVQTEEQQNHLKTGIEALNAPFFQAGYSENMRLNQTYRLEGQIEQFEALQKILVKV